MDSLFKLPMSGVREMLLREHLAAYIAPLGRRGGEEPSNRGDRGQKCGGEGVAVVMANEAVCWLIGGAETMRRRAEACGYMVQEWPTGGFGAIAGVIGRSIMELPQGSSTEVGLDGMEFTASACEQMIAVLRRSGGITVRSNVAISRLSGTATNNTNALYDDTKTALVSVKTTGVSVDTRLGSIRRALRELHADGMLMADGDDIAWALNIARHSSAETVSDEYRTLAPLGYLIISTTDATLYINKALLTTSAMDYLRQNGIGLSSIAQVKRGLNDYFEQTILMDPDEVCYTLLHATPRQLVRATSPVRALRATL